MNPIFQKAALVVALGAALPWTTCAASTPQGTVTGTTVWGVNTAAGSFDDMFTFSVGPNLATALAATSVTFSTYGATVANMSLYLGAYQLASELAGLTPLPMTTGTSTIAQPFNASTTTIASMAGALSTLNSYTLRVQGNSVGAAGYTAIVALTPVPEPETYAMLVSGFGMVGMIIGRRRRR